MGDMSGYTQTVPAAGSTKVDDSGKTRVYTGCRWIGYPVAVEALAQFAVQHGWAVSEARPTIRVSRDGEPYVRLGTKRGGTEFHIVWPVQSHKWGHARISVRRDGGTWRRMSSLASVRRELEEK